MTKHVYGLAMLALVSGCGGKAARPPETPPPTSTPEPALAPKRSMQMQGQLGSVDPKAFDSAFEAVLGDLQRCHTQRLQRLRWLSGDVKIFLRLGEDGAVHQAFFEDTTLGDRETEVCMLHVITEKRWPPPMGGEGEVHKSLGFDAPGNVRAPISWTSDEITPALVANNATIRACRGRVVGSFKATAYVVAGSPVSKNGGAKKSNKPKPATKAERREASKPRGHIVAVGVAPPGQEGLDAIDCLVDALKQMPVPSPGASTAKVTFSL